MVQGVGMKTIWMRTICSIIETGIFCLSIEEFMVGLSIEVWTFVSVFVRSVDGCVVVGMALVVNKNELQSLKGGFPWIIENVDVVEWKVVDVVVEWCENAVVNGGDINAELFLEVDWWGILRPS